MCTFVLNLFVRCISDIATPRKGIWGTPVGPLGHPEVSTVGLDDLQQRCHQAVLATERDISRNHGNCLWQSIDDHSNI